MKKIRLNISLFFLLLLLPAVAWAEKGLVVNAAGAKGNWSEQVIANRRALSVDRERESAEISLAVPETGNYTLMAYAYHDWRKAFPVLFVEAEDAKGRKYYGSRAIENAWYLADPDQGRWFQVALNDNPWWELPRGKLKIRFWVAGSASPWEENEAPVEGPVAIENFLLVPVLSGASRNSTVSFLNPESAAGDWEKIYYDPDSATGLVRSAARGQLSLHPMPIPKAGPYRLYLSLRSAVSTSLEAVIYDGKKDRVRKMRIKVKGDKSWQLLPTQIFFLEKGRYTLTLENGGDRQVDLDYIVLLPQG